jgi:fucose permease
MNGANKFFNMTLKHNRNTFLIPLIIVGTLFFLLGFSLGINGLLIPYLKKAFSLSHAESYLVLTATFSAFVIFGYPSGVLIQKIGYRRGIVLSFFLFAVGLYLFVPSAGLESFPLFLLASFISGTGNTLLQAAINPYITILGPIESAAKRMCIMTICNRSGWAIAPVFLAIFIDIAGLNVQLSDLFLPFYIIVGIFVLLGILTWFSPLPEIKAIGEDEKDASTESAEINEFVASKKSVFRFPHLLLGVITLFFYVGIDTLVLVTPVDFAETIGLRNPERYTLYSVVAISAGCILGILLIPNYMSQLMGLRIGSIAGLVFSAFIPLLPAQIAIYVLPLIGFSTCLVWGAVWPLAISNLGKYTKIGSSILVSAIVGGAVLPLIFGYLKDLTGNIQQAYWLFFPSILFIVFYAFLGYKIGLSKN